MAQPDFSDLSKAEQDAYGLMEAALRLDKARSSRQMPSIAAALEHNLQVWVAIKALVEKPDNPLGEGVGRNLLRLSNFVAGLTLKNGPAIADDAVNTLININLQICEGLLEGAAKAR